MIVDSSGELPVALPHVSDEEDDVSVFGGGGAAAVREQKVISFNITVTSRRTEPVHRLRVLHVTVLLSLSTTELDGPSLGSL